MLLENNKLLTLWRVIFTEKEYAWQHLRGYIVQHGSTKDVALLQYFEPFKPHFKSNRQSILSPVEAYKVLKFKDAAATLKKTNERLYNALSSLYKLTECFLQAKAVEENPFLPPYQVLLKIYTHHSLKEHFLDYWRNMTQLQKTMPLSNRSVFEALYLAEAYEEFQKKNDEIAVVEALHTVDDTVHNLLIINILRYTFSTIFATGQFDVKYQNPFLNPLIDYLNKHKNWAKKNPLLYVYYVLYRIWVAQERRGLSLWLKKVAAHTQLFDPDELRILYHIAINIAAIIINKDTSDMKAYRLLLEIYHRQMDLGFFLQTDNYLNLRVFRNYVAINLKLRQPREARQFIQKYQDNLALTTDKSDLLHYTEALVLFEEGKYSEVKHHTRLSQLNDKDLQLRTAIVAIKSQYELVEKQHHIKERHLIYDTTAFLDSFRDTILKDTVISQELRAKFAVFLDTMFQIIALTNNHRKGYAPAIEKQLLVENLTLKAGLLERDWLLQKCKSL